MADDGVLGDTFRSNTGSLVLNGKNTYTKPEIIEPIRNHNSSSSTSSSSSASSRGPLKKLKGKKKQRHLFLATTNHLKHHLNHLKHPLKHPLNHPPTPHQSNQPRLQPKK